MNIKSITWSFIIIIGTSLFCYAIYVSYKGILPWWIFILTVLLIAFCFRLLAIIHFNRERPQYQSSNITETTYNNGRSETTEKG
jgi:fatty acid desaturase